MIKRKSTLVANAVSVLTAVGLTVAAVAQQAPDNPSRAREVPGPAVGPAGQVGEIHYLENTATGDGSGAKMIGPYRVFPPGTKYQQRSLAIPRATSTERLPDRTAFLGTRLDMPAPKGFVEVSAVATVLNGTELDSVDYTWRGPAGTLHANVRLIPDAWLPLDISLPLPGSAVETSVVALSYGFAVVDRWHTNPDPDSPLDPLMGDVFGHFEGLSVFTASPDVGPEARTALLAELFAADHERRSSK